MERPSGFTVVELLVGLGIAAVLATLAAPGFTAYLRDCRQAATLNALLHAVHMARALAGTLGRPVRLCGSMDGTECSGSKDWSPGLLASSSGSGSTNRRFTPLGDDRSLQSVRSNRDLVEFSPLTRFATPATITVCDDRGETAARAVILSRTGRARVSDRGPGGRMLVCP